MIMDKLRKQIFELVEKYYQTHFATDKFDPKKSVIHYAGRVFDKEELINLIDSSLDFYLTSNRYAEDFEYLFANYLGVKDALLVNSGSSANLVAVTALTSPNLGEGRLKPGDEVITTAAGFPTTLAPIIQNGLKPVFIDINLGDYTANSEQLVQAVNSKTRAIIMAHTLGVPFDLNTVMELVDQYKLWLIEDNCDALGSKYNGKFTGTYGHLASHSFYPAHHITMGEGGCVVTKDEILGRICRSIRDWGRDCYCTGGENNTCGRRFSQQFGELPYGYDHKYVYSHIGYNLKVTDMQAAIGVAQLEKLPEFIEKRKSNFDTLFQILSRYEEIFILPKALPNTDPSWFAFPITIRDSAGFNRRELVQFLEVNRIETRNLFSGNLLRHPAFMHIDCRVIGDLRNTDIITNQTFFIGVYPGIEESQLEWVEEVFSRFMKGERV